jgi:GGDEF domain-containing protein
MIAAPLPANDRERLQKMEQAQCAFVPREERFDRITRTARRLLNVPIALISIVEEDVQWFRSVQGLELDQTSRDISFCGHAVAADKMLLVPDTHRDPRFRDNPLVTGAPFIRSYLGIPLSIAPGVRAGTLCVLSDREHSFRHPDVVGLQDLAAMAEAELRLTAMSNVQKRLLSRLSQLERRASLDAVTGCWNVRGFRELVALAVSDTRQNGTALALCCVRVKNFAGLARAPHASRSEAIRQVLAQVLRQRLPDNGALAVLGPSDFCALLPGASPLAVEESLARLTFPKAEIDLPGLQLSMDLELAFGMAFASDHPGPAGSTDLWATALANLKD